MRERGKIFNPVKDQEERYAWQLERSPYAREVLTHAQTALQEEFGFTNDELDLTKTSFVTNERKMTYFIQELKQNDYILREYDINHIQPKLPHPTPYIVRGRAGGKSNILLASPDLAGFCEPFDPINYSIQAMDMFVSVASAVIQKTTQKVPLEVTPESQVTVTKYAYDAAENVAGIAKFPKDPKVEKIKTKIIRELEAGNIPSLRANGATVELMLSGKILGVFFPEENVALQFLAMESAEDRFKELMADSKVGGEKWFVQPGELSDFNYRSYKDVAKFQQIRNLVIENGSDPKILLTESYMGSILLNQNSIQHRRVTTQQIVETPIAEMVIKPKKEKKPKNKPNPAKTPPQKFGKKSREQKAAEKAAKELQKIQMENENAIFDALNEILLEEQLKPNTVSIAQIIESKKKQR